MDEEIDEYVYSALQILQIGVRCLEPRERKLIVRYDKDAVHILLTTTTPSPPSTSTSSLTPWLKNLTDTAIGLLPEAFSASASPEPKEDVNDETTQVPIGAIRYVPKTNKLSRLAILSDWRKFGFGRILVEELERAAALAGREGKAEVKDGKVLIKCHSQVSHILMPL